METERLSRHTSNKPQTKNERENQLHEVRLGAIKAAIWRNKTESGDTRFSVKLCRIYKDGEAWKSSQSYNRDDLLLLAKVADQVHSWIHQQEQWASAAKSRLWKWAQHLPLDNYERRQAGRETCSFRPVQVVDKNLQSNL